MKCEMKILVLLLIKLQNSKLASGFSVFLVPIKVWVRVKWLRKQNQ